jgi:hypothetical protein
MCVNALHKGVHLRVLHKGMYLRFCVTICMYADILCSNECICFAVGKCKHPHMCVHVCMYGNTLSKYMLLLFCRCKHMNVYA